MFVRVINFAFVCALVPSAMAQYQSVNPIAAELGRLVAGHQVGTLPDASCRHIAGLVDKLTKLNSLLFCQQQTGVPQNLNPASAAIELQGTRRELEQILTALEPASGSVNAVLGTAGAAAAVAGGLATWDAQREWSRRNHYASSFTATQGGVGLLALGGGGYAAYRGFSRTGVTAANADRVFNHALRVLQCAQAAVPASSAFNRVEGPDLYRQFNRELAAGNRAATVTTTNTLLMRLTQAMLAPIDGSEIRAAMIARGSAVAGDQAAMFNQLPRYLNRVRHDFANPTQEMVQMTLGCNAMAIEENMPGYLVHVFRRPRRAPQTGLAVIRPLAGDSDEIVVPAGRPAPGNVEIQLPPAWAPVGLPAAGETGGEGNQSSRSTIPNLAIGRSTTASVGAVPTASGVTPAGVAGSTAVGVATQIVVGRLPVVGPAAAALAR